MRLIEDITCFVSRFFYVCLEKSLIASAPRKICAACPKSLKRGINQL